MRAIAPQVLDENIRGVRLGREAVVSDVDFRVGHGQPFNIVCVEAVGVLRKEL